MRLRNNIFKLLGLLLTTVISHAFEPVTTITAGAALTISVAYSGWKYLKCTRYECCDDTWIKSNFTGLDRAMKRDVHGQPLVYQVIVRVLRSHLNKKNPQKALVMSFHGWIGGGKNHVSKIIAQHLYKKGVESEFVHLFFSSALFPHQDEVETYKVWLQQNITERVKRCPRSMFIFDEIDKMPFGLIDAIKPFIDYHSEVNGVDYRRSIFIFLSNTGGQDITRVAFQFFLAGKERHDITMKDIEHLINQGAFNEKGGLEKSDIIEKHLIDVYVPFLPLEKKHVKLCIHDYLVSLNATPPYEDIMQKVADQLQYFPPEFQLYSSSGCKRIESKVDIELDE